VKEGRESLLLPMVRAGDPMSTETGSDRELARAIALQYYKMEARLEPLSQLNHAVFRLRFPDGSKILKLARGSESSSIRKELMLVGLLARHGIPVPVVEHVDEGGTLVGRPFFIMESAGDRTVADWVGRPNKLGRGLFAEMGAVLGRIHGISFPASGDIPHDGIVPRDVPAVIRRLHDLADWGASQRLLDASDVARFKSLAMPSAHGVALCHSDFHAVQCVVQDGRIVAVVDWESAWAGNPLIDFAIAHAYLEAYAPAELTDRFFAGYAALRPLPADYEQDYLPVRMAHTLGLLKVWHGQGREAGVRRAIELFRKYAKLAQG
jgi:Ser/Thr protein kinase RdoA (MazF antagonist)